MKIIPGDCRESMREMEAGSVRCCVTSPPYWGLRDYGHEGQLGLERTPEEYVGKMVDVFREVKRVLADDGTLWLNLGDSYAGNRSYQVPDNKHRDVGNRAGMTVSRRRDNAPVPRSDLACPGLKPKDLVGIPWRVAFALQQPYYTGSIARVEDRIWLAAMLDAEGCLFIHKRKAGQHNGQGYYRQNDSFGPGVEVCNTSQAVVDRILALVGKGSICTSEKGHHGRKQTLYRWNLRTTESREFVRELYPHLIAKQQQARILYGCPSSGERAEAAHAALIGLHAGIETAVDFPAPPSLHEPGYWLRSDVIWSKSNPMPESVTDRPTKAHEYLFLLAKSERYYYDAAAIAERAVGEWNSAKSSFASTTGTDAALIGNPLHRTRKIPNTNHPDVDRSDRNRRTVWTIPTQPFSEAHFATMPEALVEPCILAGSKPGDLVFDPFSGSGTVGVVALRHGRRFVGCELNPEYVAMARKRIAGPLFAEAQ